MQSEAAESDGLVGLWAWLALTDIRRGEALGLRRDDIEWERGVRKNCGQRLLPELGSPAYLHTM
ncbi:MAG: hypothetical protein K6V97_03380 [Actinomycetia bacterium]|nr:hypothetical protein [Actinomycetes bacterium]